MVVGYREADRDRQGYTDTHSTYTDILTDGPETDREMNRAMGRQPGRQGDTDRMSWRHTQWKRDNETDRETVTDIKETDMGWTLK